MSATRIASGSQRLSALPLRPVVPVSSLGLIADLGWLHLPMDDTPSACVTVRERGVRVSYEAPVAEFRRPALR